MKVISVVNQKGGVGKTTTTINLSQCLQDKGYKVLMIDLDSQGSLTMARGVADQDNIETTLPNIILKEINDEDYNIKDYILKIHENLDIIPCNIRLTFVENELQNSLSREYVLKLILNKVKKDYDFIILDCSPSLSLITINALAASDQIIIPMTPSELSSYGTRDLIKTIGSVKRKINNDLDIAGILLTMVDLRSNYAKEYVKSAKAIESYRVFNTHIPTSIDAVNPIKEHKSTIEYKPKSKVGTAYMNFMEELLSVI